MKKVLQISLALMIIISILFILPNVVKAISETPVDGGTIYAGDTKSISAAVGEVYYYTFVPDETAYYIFYSEGSVDTYGYILNSDLQSIKSDDDSGEGQNFEMTTILEKDVTYKLKAKMYNIENAGEFTIKLIKRPIIDSGTISTGSTSKSISANSWHTVTFTPSEDGIYNLTVTSSQSLYFSFNGRNYGGERIHDELDLEKDKTYKIQYHTNDFSAGTLTITINKYTAISKGTMPINTDFSVTNNNVNEYYEYNFEIEIEDKYFFVAEYNDSESEDLDFWIYDSEGNRKTTCSTGSYRLNTLKTGTYSAKLFLKGSATLNIIKQRTIFISPLAIGETKAIEINQIAVRYAFTITPTESGVYDLYTENDDGLDTYGYLMDNNGKELKADDDSGSGQNFEITYYLEKDKTYTLTVEFYNCTKTGRVRVISQENTTHSHSISTKDVVYPTCTEQGYTKYICYGCGYEYNDNYTSELGHDWDSGVATAPTCTEKGYTTHSCSRCSETMVDTYVDKLGHDWDSGVATAPTCTEKGYTTHSCNRCSETMVDTYVDALGHDWNSGAVTAPTCTEKGYTTHSCNRCSETMVDTYVDALGHNWNEGVVTKEATCSETGIKTHTCVACGITKNENIEKIAHTITETATTNIVKATTSKDGMIVNSKSSKCTVCGEELGGKGDTIVIPYPKTISLSKTSFTYSGKVQKPTVKVVGSDGKVISTSNYTVTYSNKSSTKTGRYKVTIKFKGNKYTGTKELTYDIVPKGTTLSKLVTGSKQFKATWKAQKTETSGYEVQYATNSKFTSGKKTVNVKSNKTTTSTVKKLKGNKKYYVRIRKYKTVKFGGKSIKVYSGWSKIKNITTKK